MKRIAATLIALLMLGMAVAQEAEVIDAIYYRDVIAAETDGITLETCPEWIDTRDLSHDEFTMDTACLLYLGNRTLAKLEAEILELRFDGYDWDGPWHSTDAHDIIWRYMITANEDVFAIILAPEDEFNTLIVIDLFVFPEE